MGWRLFDWRTGLFAAFIYACLPLNIRWAQNAFYLTQCQLMAMLTFWLFYEAIRVRPFHQKFLTAAAVTFCLSYLSWEGTGFLLPALFLGLVVVRWGQWWWLKEFHLYRCLFFIGARGRRSVLLPHACRCSLSPSWFRSLESHRPVAFLPRARLSADVLRRQAAALGKSRLFHLNDSGRIAFLLEASRLSLCRGPAWRRCLSYIPTFWPRCLRAIATIFSRS